MTVKMSVSYFSKFLANYFASTFENDFSSSFLGMSVKPRLISEQFAFKTFAVSAFADYLMPHVLLNTKASFFFRCEKSILSQCVDADRNTRRFCIKWGENVQFFTKFCCANRNKF
jgi:hypothetical protein